MASITDKFGKASIDSDYAIATTVKTTRSSGATVLEAFDVSKFPDDTPAFFITYKKTTDPVTGIVSVTNLVSWKALVNAGANTLTNLTLAPGYSDSGNAPGDFIELVPTSFWENTLVDGLLVSHDQDGKLKAGAISNSNMLANNTVTTPAITDASVTPAKLATVPAFEAQGSSQATSSDTFTKLTFGTATYNYNSNFSTSTSRFTATIKGVYSFTGSYTYGGTNTNTRTFLEIRKNGTQFQRSDDDSTGAVQRTKTVTTQVFLDATDYIELHIFRTSTASGFDVVPTFMGHLITPVA